MREENRPRQKNGDEEPVPFDDALRQILKAPPKKSPKPGEQSKTQRPPKRGKKA